MSTDGPTRRRLPAALLLPAVAAVVAACGSPAGEEGTASSSSPVAAALPPGAPPPNTTGGVLPAPPDVPDGCPTPPVEPEAYADAFIRAWGVGDRQGMDCLAVPEAVRYALDHTERLGPGWEKLRAEGEQQTRGVTYGSPDGTTTAYVSVNRGVFHGGPGGPQAILSIRVG